ncbi:MAG: LacI family transcriptional regulator [Epulopiscium sp.]|nr:LacI family transcriptional regulator [Candidatus Epulonipiscium sp.]
MVTQEDIAKILNISRTTVARALNGSENIKKETKEKILKLCDELGYVKNPISTSLATKKQKKIFAFLIQSKNKYYSMELIKGLKKAEKEFEFYGYKIEIIETNIDHPLDQLNQLQNIMKEERPDGIIIVPLLKEEIKNIQLRYPKTFFITLDVGIDESITYVGVDYFKSGRMAADILMNVMSKGKKVLVLDTKDDRISSELYLKGFLSRINEEKKDIIVGPIYDDDLKNNALDIIKKNITKDIEGIYSSRFLADIIKKTKDLQLNFKVVGNGMSEQIYNLILNKNMIATVVEPWEEEGYAVGKIMFNYLYKNDTYNGKKYIVESKIVFKENLR